MASPINELSFYNFRYMMLSIHGHFEGMLQVCSFQGIELRFELGLRLNFSILAASHFLGSQVWANRNESKRFIPAVPHSLEPHVWANGNKSKRSIPAVSHSLGPQVWANENKSKRFIPHMINFTDYIIFNSVYTDT
jgi:hypothetical protein